MEKVYVVVFKIQGISIRTHSSTIKSHIIQEIKDMKKVYGKEIKYKAFSL
jgi:hypothetical protein